MKNQKGFTLIELMIAVTILLFSFLAIVSGYTRLRMATSQSKYIVRATAYGQQRMEGFQYNALILAGYTALVSGIDAAPTSLGNLRVKCSWQVTQSLNPDYKEITLTVHDARGTFTNVVLSTLIDEP